MPISSTIRMRHETCWVCGIQFCMPETWANEKKQKGGSFYCPKGCHLGYGESKVEKLEKELKSVRSSRDYWIEEEGIERAARKAAVLSRSALKGHLTRTKNRIRAGVCPCCRRNFQNLARHMKGQHPKYGKEKA